MSRRLVCGLALAAGVAIVACSDQPQEQSPQAPSFAVNATPNCAPNVFNSLISGYFNPPQQQLVKNTKDQMLAALGANQPGTATTKGFDIFREIAAAAKGVPQPSPSIGSELTVEVLKCISNIADPGIIDPPPDADFFSAELDHAAGGLYEVRGGSGDPVDPVRADTGSANVVIGGAAPPPLETWNGILDGQRVLFYGEPGPNTGSYELSVVPANTSFDPPLVVTTCVEDGGDFSQMLTESNVGVLAFIEAGYICAPLSSASLERRGTFALFRRLANLGRDLLAPAPAVATVVSPGLVGGSAKGRSHFEVKPVTNLTVTTSTVPSQLTVNTGRFSLTITVKSGALFSNGMRAVLGAENNNGTPTQVLVAQSTTGPCTGSTPEGITGTGTNPTGVITFENLCITKTGKVKVAVAVNAVNRSATGFAQTNSTNVKPK
jgi:hypothetical protein